MGTATAPWKQLLFQATIGLNGTPSNGSVVFRGFQEDGDKIQINTDIEELKHCPFSEIISV